MFVHTSRDQFAPKHKLLLINLDSGKKAMTTVISSFISRVNIISVLKILHSSILTGSLTTDYEAIVTALTTLSCNSCFFPKIPNNSFAIRVKIKREMIEM